MAAEVAAKAGASVEVMTPDRELRRFLAGHGFDPSRDGAADRA